MIRVETDQAGKPKLKLYDSMTRSARAFEPLGSGPVGIYSCGPTVYARQHLGNMRPYVFADLLRRTLLSAGYAVRHVVNITDVGHLTSDADDGADQVPRHRADGADDRYGHGGGHGPGDQPDRRHPPECRESLIRGRSDKDKAP